MMEATQLSPEEAFQAMYYFLEAYYARSGESGELASVLGDLQLLPADGRPADPAVWEDWLDAVRTAKAEHHGAVTASASTPR